jgi:phenylalanyl-tRNA synthetase beta chain
MMKATANWIDSYVGTGLSAVEIADKLTLAGTEVEKQEPVGDDVCFTLEVTSNRTDCLSVIGLARELAACTGEVVEHPKVEFKTSGKVSDVGSVEIEPAALAACPYYSAIIIRSVKVGPSPAWLKKRLEGIGLKPINNVVDITNYVLFETGQPLHAFDLNKLSGKRIVVRMAKKDEPFKPVVGTGEAVKLDTSILVIADAERPQAVGGVMGGLDSGVTSKTTDVLLESAYFNPRSIREVSRRLGMDSDSSYRFERDVDQGNVLHASRRAAALIAELSGGKVCEGVLEAGKLRPQTRRLTLTDWHVQRTLGIHVPRARVEAIFRGLDLKLLDAQLDGMHVEIPSFRRDLERSIDLVEEVGRVHGLDRIPSPLRMVVETAKPSRRQRVRRLTRQVLQGMGFSESLTDTFVNPKPALAQFSPHTQGGARIEARNPVNAELPALRRNMLCSMLIALANNQRQGREWVRLYEVANVFLPSVDGAGSGERECLAIVGRDYFDVKGALETLLQALRSDKHVTVEPLVAPVFAPGRAATVKLGGRAIGVIVESSAASMKDYGVEGTCGLAEIDFEALVVAWKQVPELIELPRFPTAERDLAIVFAQTVTWAQVEVVARKAASDTLRSITLFDEFTGKQLGAGKKSLAFRLSFRHDDKTLTSEEIQAQMDAVIKAITKDLGGELRG